jgi:hypothetical protein
VSRLLRDRLLVSLSPDSVALARATRGLRPRVIAKQTIDCDPVSGRESWHGAAEAFAKAIEPARDERVDVMVVLSNQFARYTVVPFDSAISGPEEEMALARFHFTKIHGERVGAWDVRMSGGRHGAPRLASAVDVSLMQAIRACFPRSAKPRLISVQPYLMSAFNLWRHMMAKQNAWLLLVEPQQACLALVVDGVLLAAAQTSHGEFAAPDDWALMLERQQLRTEGAVASHTVLVHAPESRKPVFAETRGWTFLGLALPPVNGILPLEDVRLEVALTAR